ncbi:MAG: LytTR family DNA-binding domain-containing protein [Bacteroidetes bacterium]|nr:LytTR family DNA-binding domain-containing protein [Bacteroidota bacterium]
METIKFAIIDDNPLAHDVLNSLMEIYTNYECIDHYYNVLTAVKGINNRIPDLIFLDIEMPNLNGFELIRHIPKSIKVIVTTSHRNYAGDSFDYAVFDFLSKPISPGRLFDTISRLNKSFETENKLNKVEVRKNNISYLTVTKLKEKETYTIQKNEIYYVNKLTNHSEIHTDDGNIYYKLTSLQELFNELPENEFAFVNTSYLINLKKVITHDGENILLKDGKALSISKANKDTFKNLIIK